MRPIPRERTGQPAGTRLSFVAENPSNRDGRRQTSARGSGAIRAVSFTRGVRLEALPAAAPAERRAMAFDLLPVIERQGRRGPGRKPAAVRRRARAPGRYGFRTTVTVRLNWTTSSGSTPGIPKSPAVPVSVGVVQVI